MKEGGNRKEQWEQQRTRTESELLNYFDKKGEDMGGFGSGRWQQGKDTTSDYRQLDVRRLQRDGFLKPGRIFGWQWESGNKIITTINVHTEINKLNKSKISHLTWY